MSDSDKHCVRAAGCRALTWGVAALLLAGCANQIPPRATGSSGEPIKTAFVTLGPGGGAIARVVTTAATCPDLEVDGAPVAMSIRIAQATVPKRPTANAAVNSKPSVFPVTVCDATLPGAARRAAVGGRVLPIAKREPQRIVVVGDSGCRLKVSDGAFQACNDPVQWPFAQVAAAAAALQPDLVIHVGDYLYRENACPAGDSGCAGSPWGYGWDAWDADFFAPAKDLLRAAPWVFVRGNHESCNRAGQGWWRFLDPRPIAPRRDCNDPADDAIGDFSEPYAVPIGTDAQLLVFDSSKVVVRALAAGDPMYQTYSAQMQQAFALGRDAPHNFFLSHHPILGFAPNPALYPTGLYPGNTALQSVLQPIHPVRLFPQNVEVLLAGHNHLFEMVSFATSQPVQLISGNGGAWADASLPVALARSAQPAPGAVVESIVSTSEFGFMTLQRDTATTWRLEARDRRGQVFTTCTLRQASAHCVPETLP